MHVRAALIAFCFGVLVGETAASAEPEAAVPKALNEAGVTGAFQHGYWINGNGLYQICSVKVEGYAGQNPTCRLFIMAVADTFQDLKDGGTIPKDAAFCIPLGVTNGQESDVVVKFLADHPELIHRDAAGITFAALFEAFPCPGDTAH